MTSTAAAIENDPVLPEAICDRWGKEPYNWVETRCFLVGLFLGLSCNLQRAKADECWFLYGLSKVRESLD